MKHLKMSLYLLLTAVIFISCEKETTTLPENSEINNQQSSTKIMVVREWDEQFEGMKSLSAKISKTQTNISYLNISTALTFFDNPEVFENLTCNNLLTESFSEANVPFGSGAGTSGPWDENTSNGIINIGDIEPGIVFHATDANETVEDILMIFGGGWWFMEDGQTNALTTWMESSKLILDFPNGKVTTVGFKNYPNNMQNISIEVFGNIGSLGNTILINAFKGTYFGVNSNEPITKIVIDYGSNNFNGIDDITFGNCSNDFDGDGVLNENDAHPNSDLRRGLIIGGIRVKIDNKMVKNGSTMMDQLNDLIAEINSQYNGENYDYLHKRFMTELSQITYKWRMARLITATQRSQISSIAWGATIPYYNIET